MEYRARVVKTIKGCMPKRHASEVQIKQLVFNECPPATLQGQYYISGAMGSAKRKASGTGGGRANVFYLDPCGIALSEETPLKRALDNMGNACTNCTQSQSCAPCSNNGIVSPMQQCDDVCTASSCDEENGKCLVSRCGPLCFATWVSNGTAPKVLCPSGLPSGAIKEGIRNLRSRERLLTEAEEAFKLGDTDAGNKKMAEVVKLSAGGEQFRVPPETTTTPEPETEPPAPERPVGLQGLIQLAKEIPAVGHSLDTFRKLAADRTGEVFAPMFDNASRQRRVKKRLAARRLKRRGRRRRSRRVRRRKKRSRRRRRRSKKRKSRRRASRKKKASRRRRGKSGAKRSRGRKSRGRKSGRRGKTRRTRGKQPRKRPNMGRVPTPPRRRSSTGRRGPSRARPSRSQSRRPARRGRR